MKKKTRFNKEKYQVRVLQIRVLQIRVLQVRVLQILVLHVRVLQIRVLQVRVLQVRVLQIQSSPVQSAKYSMPFVIPRKFNFDLRLKGDFIRDRKNETRSFAEMTRSSLSYFNFLFFALNCEG